MKIKYIFILAIFAITSYLLIFSKDNGDNATVVDSNEITNKPVIQKHKPKPKTVKRTNLSNPLTAVAAMIAPPSDTELEDNWQDEYGCAGQEDCYEELSAQSYAEALWMKRKGYPSMSAINKLKELSRKDLIDLRKHGNNDANKLLAIDALNKNDLKKARRYSGNSIAHGNRKETFGYRLMAETYMQGKEWMV
ncbi:MAG: hypothetical protein L3J83_06965, partial [Proteobacteria bacterium]|nr:hypothetical protein [Pseudomonadota bacterium]